MIPRRLPTTFSNKTLTVPSERQSLPAFVLAMSAPDYWIISICLRKTMTPISIGFLAVIGLITYGWRCADARYASSSSAASLVSRLMIRA